MLTAEVKTALLEKELMDKKAETQELYLGFNSVQDTFIAQMNRIDERINSLSTSSTTSDVKDLTNKTSINRLDEFETSLASLQASLNSVRENQQQQGASDQQQLHLQGTEGV